MSAIIEQRLFIDGNWVDGTSGAYVEGINPATEEPISRAVEGSLADLDAATAAARRAFDEGPWPQMKPPERSAVLRHVAEILRRRQDELIDVVTRESGWVKGPFSGVPGAIGFFDYCADFLLGYNPRRNHLTEDAMTRPGLPLGGGVTIREPIGVVGVITPYNAPVMLNSWSLGPSLAMGNTVVFKPSPYTPLQGAFYVEAFEEAGVPPGVVNLVLDGPGVAAKLTAHPGVDMISFIGSTDVGRKVMAQAAPTLKPLVLELSGKSANVIFKDVDVAEIARSALAYLTLAGQGCSLETRILAHSSIYDDLIAEMSVKVKDVKVGDPADPSVTMGPLIRESQVQRAEQYVQSALEDGGKIAFGGRRPAHLDKGFFYEPTLIKDIDNSARVAQDEVFGPVGVIIPFDDEEHAIRLANDSPYGLGGGVHSSDAVRAWRIAQRIRSGQVRINGGSAVMLTFGGVKQSGFGRLKGDEGFQQFTQTKGVSWPIGRGLGRTR